MRTKMAVFLMALSGLGGAGCVASRPVHYYTILPGGGAAGEGRADGPVLLVGNLLAAEPLQDARIRYRAGANEAGAYEYHRWTERPSTIVRDCLTRALRDSGRYRRVLEASSAARGDYLVRGRLYEFGEVDDAGIRTRISLELELVDQKTERSVWNHLTERDEPVSGKQVKDVVQSLDRNLRQVVLQSAAEIDRFLAERR